MSSSLNKPIIILVNPQLVENIGMTARAMANCDLWDLRLVAPRDRWPLGDILGQRMRASSSGADEILEKAQVYDTLEMAVADLNYVYATAGRQHDMTNRIMTPRAAIPDMVSRMSRDQRVGILFGPERTGLTNDHLVLANAIVTVPLNPEFMSLNLAQAVLLIGYEWFQAHDKTPVNQIHCGNSMPASKADYINFYNRLETELETAGFFVAEDMRPTMTRSLQNMLERAEMTDQEIRTWHGVVSALITGPKRSKPKA
jgi:tRNA/rRNA methyltransferase